jgi:hypothetical protein
MRLDRVRWANHSPVGYETNIIIWNQFASNCIRLLKTHLKFEVVLALCRFLTFIESFSASEQ